MDKTNEFIQYKIFKSFENIVAFTTTKQSLKNKTPRFTDDTIIDFEDNRVELAKVMGIKSDQFIFPKQTHTNCVININDCHTKDLKDTDALVTNKAEICLCVQTADCVPILLFDPVNKVISAIHAGWRGTVKKIVQIAVQKMVTDFNCSPKNILVAIGPSISPEIYEVGNEVVKAVKKTIPNSKLTLSKNSLNKSHFNLWEANKQILISSGVQSNNIEILGECSYQKNDKYFSARKEGIDTGRMVSGIMLTR